MQAVPMPDIKPHQDLRSVAAQQRGALAKANGRLKDTRTWYMKVREQYAAKGLY